MLLIVRSNMFSLTPAAEEIVEKYLKLPMIGAPVNAPYFNNQRTQIKGGLAVMVGKGTPEDIGLEAEIMAKSKGFDLAAASASQIKQFLCEQNLGVDCSALAYYVLRYEGIVRAKKDLQSALQFPEVKSWWRKFLVKLRPSQNINVAVLGAPENSVVIPKNEVEPGDLIFLWNTGPNKTLNHVLIVTKVDDRVITYVHSFRWRNEGKYDHGVRTGSITWTKPNADILNDVWIEKECSGTANDTLQHALEAKKVEIRRLKIFA